MATKRTNKKEPAAAAHTPVTVQYPQTEESQYSATESALAPRAHPELVFGLVGPIGVNLDPVISALARELHALKYNPVTIRLSEQIEAFFGSSYNLETEDHRISKLMDAGTRLRAESERGDAVALLGIAEIARTRQEDLGGKSDSNAFI